MRRFSICRVLGRTGSLSLQGNKSKKNRCVKGFLFRLSAQSIMLCFLTVVKQFRLIKNRTLFTPKIIQSLVWRYYTLDITYRHFVCDYCIVSSYCMKLVFFLRMDVYELLYEHGRRTFQCIVQYVCACCGITINLLESRYNK